MGRSDHVYIWLGLDYEEGLGGYYHHGIDDGFGFVYHYTSENQQKTVKSGKIILITAAVPYCYSCRFRKTSWRDFVGDSISPVHVVSYQSSHDPDEVIRRCEEKLGYSDYNLIINNCEHFARWCKTGFNVSHQVTGALFGAALGTLRFFLGRGSLICCVFYAYDVARLYETWMNNRCITNAACSPLEGHHHHHHYRHDRHYLHELFHPPSIENDNIFGHIINSRSSQTRITNDYHRIRPYLVIQPKKSTLLWLRECISQWKWVWLRLAPLRIFSLFICDLISFSIMLFKTLLWWTRSKSFRNTTARLCSTLQRAFRLWMAENTAFLFVTELVSPKLL